MSYFIEHRRTVERGSKLTYVPLEAERECTGFRSVYAVDAALRDLILGKGSVAGMENMAVYSDILFLDFDSDDGVEEARDTLCSMGAQFAIYSTGRRGRHFHVAIEPMFGASVPHSQLRFVSTHFAHFDPTVYRPHSIIRLPGTWHEKAPGHMKHRMEFLPGNLLKIPVVSKPPPVPSTESEGEANPTEFWASVLSPRQTPGRTFRLFRLGVLAARAGVPFDEALTAARSWAQTIATPPLNNEREIQRVFSNGYNTGVTDGG
jgi:hypothetical protein